MGCSGSNDFRNEKEELEKKIKRKKEEQQKLQEELRQKNLEQKKLKEKIKQLSTEIQEYKDQTLLLKNEKNTLKEENEKLSYEKKQLEENIIFLNRKGIILKDKCDDLQDNQKKIEEENLDLYKALDDIAEKQKLDEMELNRIRKGNKEIEDFCINLENKKEIFLNNFRNNKENIRKCIDEKISMILIDNTEFLRKEILNLIKGYDSLKKVKHHKNKIIKNAIYEFSVKTRHLNIILMGKSGTGKSSLINSLIGKKVANTGGFRPVTKEIMYYESESIRLFDTEGTELSKNNKIEITLKKVNDLIKESKNKQDPDWFIHCIWYCVSDTRFEEVEEKPIEALLKSYEDESMPIIIVYLRALIPRWINEMKKGIEEITSKRLNRKIEFVSVLAEDAKLNSGHIENKFGLDDLIRKTLFKIQDSVYSMSFEYVLNLVKVKIKDIFLKTEKPSKESINFDLVNSIINYYKKILGKLDDITINLIQNSISNLKILCVSADFNYKIMDYLNKFIKRVDINIFNNIKRRENNLINLNSQNLRKYSTKKDKSNSISPKKNQANINDDIERNNKLKKIYYEKIKNKIKDKITKKFKKVFEDYKQNELHKKIFDFYIDLIKIVLEKMVSDDSKYYKDEIIADMKKSIKSNRNFLKLFSSSRNYIYNNSTQFNNYNKNETKHYINNSYDLYS